MIQLSEDEVPGNPGAPDYEADARRRALEALSRPPEPLGPIGTEGEAAQAIGDAQRATMPAETRAGDMGLRPEDAIPPTQGGPATLAPEPAAAPTRRVQLTEQDVPAFTARAPRAPAQVPPSTTQPPSAAVPVQKTGTSSESAMDRELRAAREQRARRMIMNTLASAIEVGGSLGLGVPVPTGQPTQAGPGEDEARIMREHRLAAAQKEREGREAELAQARQGRESQLEDREMALRERALALQEERARAPRQTTDLDAARAEQIRTGIAGAAARRDPFSPESRAAQSQFAALVDTLPPAFRSRLGATFSPERIRGMSADELDAPTRRIAAFRERGTAGGSGSPGGSERRAATRSAIVAGLVQRGMSEEQASAAVDAMGADRAAAAIASDTLARGRTDDRMHTQREEILPGVFAGVDLSPGEARSMRDGFSSMRTSVSNMAEVEGIAQRYGTSGVLSPEARAEMRPRLVTLRAMVAQMGNTGVINPSEVRTINEALPNPTDVEQMTVGDFRAQLRAWRSQLDASVRSQLISRGVDEDGVRTAMGLLHGGSHRRTSGSPTAAPGAQPPTAPAADMVRVRRRSDGALGQIPRDRVTDAYEVVQ